MTFIKIIGLGSDGEGVGTLPDGRKVFVDGALPGEEIEADVHTLKKNFAIGTLLKVLTPSPHRIKPPCPLFSRCGGCQIMQLSYEEQLVKKRERVIDALERIGHLKDVHVHPTCPSPSPLHYRNKIQLPIVWEGGSGKIGLYRKNSHEVIPLTKCYIQCELGEKILRTLTPLVQECTHLRHVLIKNAIHKQESLVIFVTRGQDNATLKRVAERLMREIPEIKGVVENINRSDSNVILGDKIRPLAGRPYIFETILGKTFKISPHAFFQVNTLQAENLYSKALKLANLTPDMHVIDAYCGVGTLSLLASSHVSQVTGIECVEPAIADAKENAALNDIKNCHFLCGKTEELLPTLKTPDVLILNPPRKGCEASVLHAISLKRIPRLIYISCDPATLARDLALLTQSGYQIEHIEPFDMFPMTMHVETLVLLTLPQQIRQNLPDL